MVKGPEVTCNGHFRLSSWGFFSLPYLAAEPVLRLKRPPISQGMEPRKQTTWSKLRALLLCLLITTEDPLVTPRIP